LCDVKNVLSNEKNFGIDILSKCIAFGLPFSVADTDPVRSRTFLTGTYQVIKGLVPNPGNDSVSSVLV
jgi:hypothetical protein